MDRLGPAVCGLRIGSGVHDAFGLPNLERRVPAVDAETSDGNRAARPVQIAGRRVSATGGHAGEPTVAQTDVDARRSTAHPFPCPACG